ncbi:ATP synthase complex assembly protein atp12, partial [Ascosphaera acerosa]
DVQGPPPAPAPPTTGVQERLAWKNHREEMLRGGVTSRVAKADAREEGSRSEPVVLTKRFWKDVHVKEVPDGYQIQLDSRFVRCPSDKAVLTVPRSKPTLAHAIALEWDALTLAKHALKPHLIPLTGLVDRARDVLKEDERVRAESAGNAVRAEILDTVMRYFDTDTLLSWAPGRSVYDGCSLTAEPGEEAPAPAMGRAAESLRDVQIRTAREIASFLATWVWPGVRIAPAFEGESIFPTPQPAETRRAVRAWAARLGAYDLAGLERATLASKSLLIAARLVVEWSEEAGGGVAGTRSREDDGSTPFGLEEAARAATLEVAWQTRKWGEVEDTHDVDKEDVRRQLGSVVLLVTGEGRR